MFFGYVCFEIKVPRLEIGVMRDSQSPLLQPEHEVLWDSRWSEFIDEIDGLTRARLMEEDIRPSDFVYLQLQPRCLVEVVYTGLKATKLRTVLP